jgi:hypothetical protein
MVDAIFAIICGVGVVGETADSLSVTIIFILHEAFRAHREPKKVMNSLWP